MKNLLYKELRLALHPAAVAFLSLSAMLLIPNYPYYVILFYTTLGIFFICMTGRENHDLEYSVALPARKEDVAAARILLCVLLELTQLLIAIPFAVIRQTFHLPGNQVGMDANIAFFGMSLLLFGLYHLLFFPSYFGNPSKVGRCFVISSILFFLLMFLAEALTHILPLFRDRLDTPDPQFLPEKLALLLIGAAIYALCSWWTYRRAAKRFNALDLS